MWVSSERQTEGGDDGGEDTTDLLELHVQTLGLFHSVGINSISVEADRHDSLDQTQLNSSEL
jgi:hypothetical protein